MKRTGWKKIICAMLTLFLLFTLAGAALADQVLLDLDFSDRSGLWFYVQEGGQGQLYFENGAAMMDIYDPGIKEWAVQTYCTGLRLVNGTSYEVSMDVRSSAERDVTIGLQHNGGDWHTYVTNTVRAEHGMHRYTFQFTMNEPTDDQVMLYVNLGYFDSMKGTPAEEQHQVYLDNISMKILEQTGNGGRSADSSAPAASVTAAPATAKPTATPTVKPTATPTPKPTKKADEETLFDKYAKPSVESTKRIVIENNHPAYDAIPSARYAMRSEDFAETSFAMAWYDLLEGELARGIPINDTFAADIYRGMTNKDVYIMVAAESENSNCVNFVVAVLDKKADKATGLHFGSLYWIEWNSAKNTIRAVNQYGGDEQIYSAWALNATGGNTIMGRLPPKGSLHLELKGSKNMRNGLMIMYATMNDAKAPPIK